MWDSNPRPQCLSGLRQLMPLDRAATLISTDRPATLELVKDHPIEPEIKNVRLRSSDLVLVIWYQSVIPDGNGRFGVINYQNSQLTRLACLLSVNLSNWCYVCCSPNAVCVYWRVCFTTSVRRDGSTFNDWLVFPVPSTYKVSTMKSHDFGDFKNRQIFIRSWSSHTIYMSADSSLNF
jgi:hypothetical protein